jgi:hypothetical protein
MQIIYKAEDGTLFENEQECRKYENLYINKEKFNDAVKLLRDFCANMKCPSCQYCDGVQCRLTGIPESWEVEV